MGQAKKIDVIIPVKAVIEMPPEEGEHQSLHLIQSIANGTWRTYAVKYGIRIGDGSPIINFRGASIIIDGRGITLAVIEAVNDAMGDNDNDDWFNELIDKLAKACFEWARQLGLGEFDDGARNELSEKLACIFKTFLPTKAERDLERLADYCRDHDMFQGESDNPVDIVTGVLETLTEALCKIAKERTEKTACEYAASDYYKILEHLELPENALWDDITDAIESYGSPRPTEPIAELLDKLLKMVYHGSHVPAWLETKMDKQIECIRKAVTDLQAQIEKADSRLVALAEDGLVIQKESDGSYTVYDEAGEIAMADDPNTAVDNAIIYIKKKAAADEEDKTDE